MTSSEAVKKRTNKKARRKHRRRRRARTNLLKFVLLSGLLILAYCGFCYGKNHIVSQFKEWRQPYLTENSQPPDDSLSVNVSSMDIGNSLLQQLQAMDLPSSQLKQITGHIEDYPERMLEALTKNEELLDYVLAYPENKDLIENDQPIDLKNDCEEGKIPLFLQWDSRWGYHSYGKEGLIGLDGCGPTCLSMVIVGLTRDLQKNPQAIASFSADNGYLDPAAGTTWALMTTGARQLGIQAEEIRLDESVMKNELYQGHPIICSMRPGDFTTTGHFIVLTGYRDGEFTVNDPNSRSRSLRTWSYEELSYQIKNLWAFSV